MELNLPNEFWFEFMIYQVSPSFRRGVFAKILVDHKFKPSKRPKNDKRKNGPKKGQVDHNSGVGWYELMLYIGFWGGFVLCCLGVLFGFGEVWGDVPTAT